MNFLHAPQRFFRACWKRSPHEFFQDHRTDSSFLFALPGWEFLHAPEKRRILEKAEFCRT